MILVGMIVMLTGCATFTNLPVETQQVLANAAVQLAQNSLDAYLKHCEVEQVQADSQELAKLNAALAAAEQALETIRGKAAK
jgi:hypothetical protein